MRADADIDIPIGTVAEFHDERHGGDPYIFIGWGRTSVGHEAIFVRALIPGNSSERMPLWTFRCSMTSTLLRRFPSLEKYKKQEGKINA